MHVMIDIEALGNELKTGPIIAIGAVAFEMEEQLEYPTEADFSYSACGKVFYTPVSLAEYKQYGLMIDEETLQWWLKTDSNLLREFVLAPVQVSIREMMCGLKAWITDVCADEKALRLWSHGVTYDCQHLAEKWPIVMGESFNRVCPFRQMRDTRTLFDAYKSKIGVDPLPLFERKRRHHPLEDAWVQACAVQIAWKGLMNG